MYLRRVIGIEQSKLFPHRLRSPPCKLAFKLRAHIFVLRRPKCQRKDRRVRIKSRSARKDGQLTTIVERLRDFERAFGIFERAEFGVRFDDVDHVHGYAALRLGGLGGAYVHVAVYLHAVARNDLAACTARAFRGERRLAACGRSDNEQCAHQTILLNNLSRSLRVKANVVGLPCGH